MRRLLILGLCAALAACSSKDNANNTMNVDENLTTTDMNATGMNAVDGNATTDMNAAADENVTDMNAKDMNASADMNAAPPMADGHGAENTVAYPADGNQAENEVAAADGAAAENVAANAPADAKVEKGVGAFVEPPRMKVKKWYPVEFLVAPKAKGPGEMTAGTIEGEAQGKPTTAPDTVFLALQMRVTLKSDPNVEITPKSEDVQAIGLDKAATWQWNVSPQTAGEHELSALVQPLDAHGKEIDRYTRYVTVRADATLGGQIDEATTIGEKLTKFFMSWRGAVLALAALIAALFVLMRTIKSRGRDGSEPPSDENKHDG